MRFKKLIHRSNLLPIHTHDPTPQHQERLKQLQLEKAQLQKEFQALDARVEEERKALTGGSRPRETEQVSG